MKKIKNKSPEKVLIKLLFLNLLFLGLLLTGCQEKNEAESKKIELSGFEKSAEIIKSLGLSQERAYDFLKLITSAGGRLPGSPQAEQAVERTVILMRQLGFDRVWTEPVRLNRWLRGQPEQGLIKSKKYGRYEVKVCALGNSVATPAGGLETGVIEVKTFEELSFLKDKVKNKIVFFNVVMDRTLTEPFAAYSLAAQFRVRGASEAAKYGARAVLVRSLTLRRDEYPHTGLMHYDEKFPEIPAAAISTADAERLHLWLKEDPELRFYLKMDCYRMEPVISSNVIGQLNGKEKPEEIILVGGHLDCWDLGSGAHDDAAGCAVAIEVLRLIKESGLKPRRTIRAVLFMGEEFGGTGGLAYALQEDRKQEKLLVAIEQDRGGFAPAGLALGSQSLVEKLRIIEKYLKSLGVNWIREGGGGVDIAPLSSQGVILGSLIPDSQKYFDYHHCALDLPEAVHPRELELQAVILATVIYYLAEEGV